MMNLRFPISEIDYWSNRYSYARNEQHLLDQAPGIRKRKHLNRGELLSVCRWKSPRSAGHALKNEDNYVTSVTTAALSSPCERFRIEVLTCLSGVNWPTASVILHLFHVEPYPIMDVRALWSVGSLQPSQYDFGFWSGYVNYCRKLASTANVGMRALDRALWQFSKEMQPLG